MIKKNIYTNFDECYKDLVNLVAKEGIWSTNPRTKYIDGTPANFKSTHDVCFTLRQPSVDFNGNQWKERQFQSFINTTRKVAWKSSIRELFWIWIMRSNKVQDLRNLGCKYWDEFELKDGTIGKSYAYQLAKPMCGYPSQVDYVIGEIKNNPNNRRILTELWHVEDTPEMSLTPCVHLTQWHVEGNTLHLSIRQRSADIALGIAANCHQYSVLHQLIAKECNLKVGDLTWYIGNAHIYDRHYDDLLKQVNERKILTPPVLEIPEFKSIYDIYPDDIKMVTKYKVSGEPIKYEVAI